MKVFLSPAKNMRAMPAARPGLPAATAPRWLYKTEGLALALRAKAPYALESILQTSPAIALRAAALYQDWRGEGGVPAIFAYDGLAYKYLEAETLSADDLRFAQDNLRLFSALYGPLRPLDAIQPYRLELAHKIDGKSLYDFWGRAFYDDLFGAGEGVAVNLASNEYSKAVRPHLRPDDRLVTCEFLTYRKGKLRCLATAAKMARGRMARYIIRNRIESPEQLTFFDWNDFRYEQSLSDNQTLTFITRA